jgi:hypothetical protein
LFEMDENPVPTKTNPLGVKGAGEAGNVGALARHHERRRRRAQPARHRSSRHAGHPRKGLARDPRCATRLRPLWGERQRLKMLSASRRAQGHRSPYGD